MPTTIHVEGVWKVYGAGTPREVVAVRDVSLKAGPGRVTALGGPSGSGKTTLLCIMGLLTRPTRGRVFIDGTDLTGVSEVFRTRVRRQKIGFVFQAQYLLPQLTAVENVALPLLCTDISRAEAEELAEERLTELGLGHRLHFRVAELSGGEQQRVSIARSLIRGPEVLIADEPSSSIDARQTADLLAVLRGMVDSRGLAVIVASHDPRVLDWADHVYWLRDGRVVEAGQ